MLIANNWYQCYCIVYYMRRGNSAGGTYLIHIVISRLHYCLCYDSQLKCINKDQYLIVDYFFLI